MVIQSIGLKKQRAEKPLELTKNQYALILPIGDVHFGAPGFPKDRFISHLQWGIERGAYFLGMGEYLDFTSESQRSVMINLRDSTRASIDDMIKALADEYVEKIAFTKGRWLGLLKGDHSWTFLDGRNVEQYIAQKLETNYFGTSCVLRIFPAGFKNESADVVLYCHHGVGFSQTLGGQLNRPKDLAFAFDADIVLMGHSHAKIIGTIDKQIITRRGLHYHRTIHIARTGGWFRGYLSHLAYELDKPAIYSEGTYVEKRGYLPTSIGGLVIGIGYDCIDGTKEYKPLIHMAI